ncbi:hypothetical protein EON62_05710 [archaeon]|nr:MAG: hypothetical protein EON62_05710 [archaeon]
MRVFVGRACAAAALCACVSASCVNDWLSSRGDASQAASSCFSRPTGSWTPPATPTWTQLPAYSQSVGWLGVDATRGITVLQSNSLDVVAVHTQNGSIVWDTGLYRAGALARPTTIVGGVVASVQGVLYVQDQTNLRAVDVASGTLRWTSTIPYTISGSANLVLSAAQDSLLIMASAFSSVPGAVTSQVFVAFSTQSGALLWQYVPTWNRSGCKLPSVSPPTSVGTFITLCAMNMTNPSEQTVTLAAVSMATGKPVWSRTLPAMGTTTSVYRNYAAPAVDTVRGRVFVSCTTPDAPGMYVLSLATGMPIAFWRNAALW